MGGRHTVTSWRSCIHNLRKLICLDLTFVISAVKCYVMANLFLCQKVALRILKVLSIQ
jgi:hypothetical protein